LQRSGSTSTLTGARSRLRNGGELHERPAVIKLHQQADFAPLTSSMITRFLLCDHSPPTSTSK
ncbi:MAG: hypothetical protein ACPIOQ_20370, partial [Promethearchaeia archaeon]